MGAWRRARPPDRDQTIDLLTGIVNGPSYLEFNDKRARFTLRQDLSAMQPDFNGSHDFQGETVPW